MFRAVCSMKYS